MKRLFDSIVSILLIAIFFIPMCILAVLIKLNSRGPVLHWSDRVGRDNIIFKMPKFRSMYLNTDPIASHLMENPDKYITSIGKFIRRTSLDELPQLYSVLRGEMSFVGPRPALFNQYDLINLRSKKGVHKLTPGITGLAQVNGRDEISISHKVKLDEDYMNKQSFWFDVKIMCKTFYKVFNRAGISH